MVAVDTCDSVAIASGVKDIGKAGSGGDEIGGAHLAGRGHRVKGPRGGVRSQHLITDMRLIY